MVGVAPFPNVFSAFVPGVTSRPLNSHGEAKRKTSLFGSRDLLQQQFQGTIDYYFNGLGLVGSWKFFLFPTRITNQQSFLTETPHIKNSEGGNKHNQWVNNVFIFMK